jgi:hypothetical protein
MQAAIFLDAAVLLSKQPVLDHQGACVILGDVRCLQADYRTTIKRMN